MKISIKDRITEAYSAGMTLTSLAYRVFPPALWPRAWHHAAKGGPPAWSRTLCVALRRYGFVVDAGSDGIRRVWRRS